MSAAINAVAFAGWETSVSSAAHAGWLVAAAVAVPPVEELDAVADIERDLLQREEEEVIAIIIALHESRR